MRWLILNSTKEGDTVADLFMGSGTTGAAALETGRNFIGIEQDEHWYRVAEERLEQVAQIMRGGVLLIVICSTPLTKRSAA